MLPHAELHRLRLAPIKLQQGFAAGKMGFDRDFAGQQFVAPDSARGQNRRAERRLRTSVVPPWRQYRPSQRTAALSAGGAGDLCRPMSIVRSND